MQVSALIERGARAALSVVTSLLLWYLVPSILLEGVRGLPLEASGLTFLSFALVIGGLSSMSHLLEGTQVSFVLSVGSDLATIAFLVLISGGGRLTLILSGVTVSADFTPLLLLMITPSAFSVVKKVWNAVSASAGAEAEWSEGGQR